MQERAVLDRRSRPARNSAAAPADRSTRARNSAVTSRTERPDTSIDWLELVGPSSGASCVSPDRMVMRSRATSSSSAAICASAVSTPWPISTLPTASRTVRSGWKRSHFVQAAIVDDAQRQGIAHGAAPSRNAAAAFCDRAQDARMRAAAAQMLVQRGDDLRPRRAVVAVQQRLGRHDDAGQTIAALAGLLLQERLLQRMRRRCRAPRSC